MESRPGNDFYRVIDHGEFNGSSADIIWSTFEEVLDGDVDLVVDLAVTMASARMHEISFCMVFNNGEFNGSTADII